MFPFARGDVFPSWWANAIQRFISTGAPSFRLRRVNTTTIEVPAGAGEDAAVIAVDGRWRWNEATVSRAHPGGGAGTYRVWVTARVNNIVNTPEPGTDQTVYAFALAITTVTTEPTFIAGSVEVWRLVGTVEWSGSAITRVDQTDPPSPSHAYSHAAGGDDPVTAGSVGAVSLPPGSTSGLVPVTDANGVVTWQRAGAASLAAGAVSNVAVATNAAIAESKLALASDAVAGTASRRTLGPGAAQAAPGNDARFPVGADIVDADVGAAAAIAESKLALASDVAAAANLLPNPRYAEDLTGWVTQIQAGMTNLGSGRAVMPDSSEYGMRLYVSNPDATNRRCGADLTGDVAVTPGVMYSLAVDVYAVDVASANNPYLWLAFYDSAGAYISQVYPRSPTPVGRRTRMLNQGVVAPAGAANAKVRVTYDTNSANDVIDVYVTNWMLNEGPVAHEFASRRSLGTGANQAAPGNDARLSDQRTPTDNSVGWDKTGAGTSGFAGGAFGEFRDTDTSAAAGSIVPFNVVIYRIGATFAGGKFTCQRAGLYEFNATISCLSAVRHQAKLVVAEEWMDEDASPEFLRLHGVREMSVGQQAYVVLDTAATVRGGRRLSHFNGRMIGR